MFLLFLFVLIIQFLTYWIFEPLTTFLEYVFQVKFFPIVALLAFFLLLSTKKSNLNYKSVDYAIGEVKSLYQQIAKKSYFQKLLPNIEETQVVA